MRIENFFAELKRRNVYKVAVAYIFAGWALSQGIAQVFPVFDVPNWVIRLIVLLIIIGLPIALVLAWSFELTPQGIKRTETADAMPETTRSKKYVWIYVVVIGAILSIGLFFLGRYTALDTASSARSSNKSIAVLPFSDLSPNHDQESFSVGMAEEILNALAHIRGLKVVGRSSSFFYKGKNVSLKQIGSELGVANVLEGSVRKQGEQVRDIDARSAEAYAAVGYICFCRRRYREMVEPAERGIAIDPNNVTANFWLANQLAAMGRLAEAETVNDRALGADPANALLIFYKSMARWDRGDKATAVKLGKRAQALGSPLGESVLGFSAAAEGDPDSGAESFSEGFGAFKSGFSKEELAAIFRGSYGDEAKRTAGLTVIAAHPHDQFAGTLLLLLGEPEQSFASFERDGIGLSDAYYTFLWQPAAWSRKARQHPAFQAFAKRIGLVDYWKQNRWPDLCQPTPERGPDAFTCQ